MADSPGRPPPTRPDTSRVTRASLVAVSVTILLWGMHGPVGKQLLEELAWPVVIVFNFAWAVVFLWVYCAATGRLKHLRRYPPVKFLQLALAGAVGVFTYYALLFYSFSYAGEVFQFQVLNYLFPVMTVLFSAALIPGERLTVPRTLSVVVAFLGAYWALTRGRPLAFDIRSPAHALAALGAATSYGLFSTVGRRLRYEPVSGALIFFTVSIALAGALLALMPASGPKYRLPHGTEWLRLAFVGIASNCLGTLFWFRALRTGDSALVGSLVYLAVFVSALGFRLINRESIGLSGFLGAAIVVVGALLASRPSRVRPASPPASGRTGSTEALP